MYIYICLSLLQPNRLHSLLPFFPSINFLSGKFMTDDKEPSTTLKAFLSEILHSNISLECLACCHLYVMEEPRYS